MSNWFRTVVFKLFWVVAHLEVFDLTAAHLEPMHQAYSSAFILLVKNFLQNIATLKELWETEKFGSRFNVNGWSM